MMIYGPHNSFCPDPEKPEYLELIDYQMTELPDECYEWLEDLCKICNKYKLPEGHPQKKVKHGYPIHCRMRSLCAAVLWEKVKSLFLAIPMAGFAKMLVFQNQQLPTRVRKCVKYT